MTSAGFIDDFETSLEPDAIHYSPPASGRVGINEPLPFAALHVSRAPADPLSSISLDENSGVALFGPIIGQNLGFDSHQIQARTGEYVGGGPTIALTASSLNLQPRGGDIVIHGDDALCRTM